jgi:uncharacterized membrane protein YqgA involved in biofilm formation
MILTGNVINAAGIIAGGIIGLCTKKPLSVRQQSTLKVGLGAATVWFGLKLTWTSLNGSFWYQARQLGVVLLAMALGKFAGKLLHIQKLSNRVGQFATKKLTAVQQGNKPQFDDGFLVAAGLFCAGPLAILASVQEGLRDFSPLFIVKGVMDGLATMAFVATFGWSTILAAIPVLAFQGTIFLVLQLYEPHLRNQPWPLIDSVLAVDGLLIFCVALIVLQLKKIEVADYLPSLAIAPLLAWVLL